MKHIRLLLNFYSRNKLPAVILLVVFTLATLIASNALGEYRNYTYAEHVFEKSGLNDSVYFMPSGFEMDSSNLTPDVYRKNVLKIGNQIKKFSCVESLTISPKEIEALSEANCIMYDDNLLKSFPMTIAEGKGLDKNSCSDIHAAQGIDAVLCGYVKKDIPVGSTITVPTRLTTNSGYTDAESLKIHVIGKVNDPTFSASFGIAGNCVDAEQLLKPYPKLIIRETPQLLAALEGKISIRIDCNFFVNFKPTSTEQEKKACLLHQNQNGTYLTYSEIMENTKISANTTLKEKMPMPLFFLFIATISLISISILFVCKKMKESTIYYLCGCSRKRSYAYMAGGIGLISIVGGILNIIFIANVKLLSSTGLFYSSMMVMDQCSILFVLGYMVFALLLSIGIPYAVYRKSSPIEAYRRAEV